MDMIAPFRSRSDALRLHNALKDKRIASTVIDTPRRQGLSCGLSVVFSSSQKAAVEQAVMRLRLGTFLGFFNK